MGTDHGKKKDDEKKSKIKKPLKKPKAIDKINRTSKKQMQTQKPKVRKALKESRQAKESSKKTTITDTQKRGQVRQRYDLFEGRRLPKEPTKKPTKKEPTKFLPHVIKPLYFREEKESKNKSGVMA